MNIDSTAVICVIIPLTLFTYSILKSFAYLSVERELMESAMANRRPKPSEIWRMRDGKEITLKAMEDLHLINSIKMVARNCHRPSYLGEMKNDETYKRLCKEAKRRKFTIITLDKPLPKDGRLEYVEVLTPTPRSRLSATMREVDLDSRPME